MGKANTFNAGNMRSLKTLISRFYIFNKVIRDFIKTVIHHLNALSLQLYNDKLFLFYYKKDSYVF